MIVMFVLYQEKGSPNYVREFGQSYSQQPGCRPSWRDGGRYGNDTGLCSEDMSVTNSEVESAMNHRRRRAVLRDLGFSKDAFDAFSSADAYIRTARDGLGRATKQHLTDVQVRFLLSE